MEKKDIVLAVCICELIIIPTVYIFAGNFVILTAVVAILAGVIIWATMNAAGKKSNILVDRYKRQHPNENILYSDLADLRENKRDISGTIIITEKGISFFVEREDDIEESTFFWNELAGYKCDTELYIQLLDSNIILEFKVFSTEQIDNILSQYIKKIAE